MIEVIRNIVAIIRGNILCVVFRIRHDLLVRLFSGAQFNIKSSARVNFERGVMIGRNTIITVRENAVFSMGEMSSLNADCKIACQEKITIGKNTIFGPNVFVYDHDHVFDYDGVKRNEFVTKPVQIGENCWIGAGTIILKGTVIGDRCVIGAGSVVKGNIPAGSIFIQRRQDRIIDNNKDEAIQ